MQLSTLRVSDLRLFEQAELNFLPGINFISGGNGAGKTTLLEAVHLLGYGRSFRVNARDGLLRAGADTLSVFARWTQQGGQELRTGMSRSRDGWEARINGSSVSTLSELHQACAVICFEPGSHALLAGGADQRRRHTDWGLFHVEPDFLATWRRYQRALRQRNSLLKQGVTSDAMIAPWEAELSQSAEVIDRLRDQHLRRTEATLVPIMNLFLPELGDLRMTYRRGWSKEQSLSASLGEGRDRDARLGYTFSGPHRADWALRFSLLPETAPLSRGQEKLAALACILAQANLLVDSGKPLPLVLLDDMASELDLSHQHRVWSHLQSLSVQVLATGTELPASLPNETISRRFHVERRSGVGSVKQEA